MWTWLQKWSAASSFALYSKRREDEGIMHDDPDQLGAVEELGINNRNDLVGFLSLILHTAYIHDD
jgi:hypothetical protein